MVGVRSLPKVDSPVLVHHYYKGKDETEEDYGEGMSVFQLMFVFVEGALHP